MVVIHLKRACGIFPTRDQVEGALEELRASGFAMNQVSVINKEPEQAVVMENNAQEGTNIGAIAGGAVGGTVGLLVGLGTAALIPGLGPIALLGAAATALATTVTSGVIGATAGGLIGGLIGYGVLKEDAVLYNERIAGGSYFLMLDGTETEMRKVATILNRWNIEELRIFDATPLTPTYPERA
jgi:uncharacterized protein YcfJ